MFIPGSVEGELSKYIVFEGNDGSGKTTIAEAIYDKLPGEKIYTKEPGSPLLPFCQEIRQIIIHGKDHNIDDITYAHLFYSDAHENIRQIVKPALATGRWVVSDRSILSNKAYWPGRVQYVHELHHVEFKEMNPTVFYLDVSPEECGKRMLGRDKEVNEFEKQHVLTKLDKIHWRYQNLVLQECRDEGINHYQINNMRSLDKVINIVWGIIKANYNLTEGE